MAIIILVVVLFAGGIVSVASLHAMGYRLGLSLSIYRIDIEDDDDDDDCDHSLPVGPRSFTGSLN